MTDEPSGPIVPDTAGADTSPNDRETFSEARLTEILVARRR